MERTPKTEGYTQTNIYRSDWIFEMYRDSVLQARTPYSVRYEHVPPFPAGFVIRYDDSGLMPQLIGHLTDIHVGHG